MKKVLSIILIFGFAVAASAVTGSANYTSPMNLVGVGGGNSSSGNYTNTSAVGAPAVGRSSSANYIGLSGGLGITVFAGDIIPPSVTGVQVDSRAVVANDYIKKDGTLTATVTDETAINTAASSVEIDGAGVLFSALTGASSYNSTTGALSFKLAITADGNHTIKIHAVDTSGNSTDLTITAKVDNGELKAVSVYSYPNPYKGAGNMTIAYNLNKDADTAMYVFNAIGRLVYKKSFVSGAEGAHTGYNEISWDVKSDFGDVLGNDIYFLRVVSGGKPVGRAKIAVIK